MGAWGRPDSGRRIDVVADGLLVGALVLATVVALVTGTPVGPPRPGPNRPSDVLAVVLGLAQVLPLVFRRRYPIPVALVTFAAFVAADALWYPPSPSSAGVVVALFGAPSYCPPGRLRFLVGLYAAFALTELAVLVSSPLSPAQAAWRVALGVAVALAGFLTRARADSIRRLEAQAARLDRERVAADRAAAAARVHLSRELHDVVTHHVTAMVVQADAAQVRRTGGRADADDDLAAIAGAGRRALAELRQLLDVLQATEPPVTDEVPSPRTLANLHALVARTRDTGQPVGLTVRGTPVPLPTEVDVCTYRVLQEALTNVLRHGGGQPAEVTVRWAPEVLEIEVVNAGPRHAAPVVRYNHGLIGMRERLRVFGGALEAGPRPEGGFRVAATLPLVGYGT